MHASAFCLTYVFEADVKLRLCRYEYKPVSSRRILVLFIQDILILIVEFVRRLRQAPL